MIKRFLTSLAAAALLACGLLATPAAAATQNYAVGQADVELLTFHVSGQYTATTAGVVEFTLPFPAQLIGVSATARASGGTTPTLAIDVNEGGTTVLSADLSITAGTVGEATIADDELADEANITIDFAITGTSPTWNDITIVLVVVRK